MDNNIVKEKLSKLVGLPDKIKNAIDNVGELKNSAISRERIINLYGLRRLGNIHDANYEVVNLQIEEMLAGLKACNEEMVRLITVTSLDIYATIFTDIEISQIFGSLDLTGSGNTRDFLNSHFFRQ